MDRVEHSDLNPLVNSLVTADQLRLFDETHSIDERSLRFAQALLTQAAGILLRLPQEVVATALVVLQRFWIAGHGHGHVDALPKIASQASIYLSAKVSFTPVSPRSVCNVYAYLLSTSSPLPFFSLEPRPASPEPNSYFVSEGTYERERDRLLGCESVILASIGFHTSAVLPHSLALTYLQTLGVTTAALAIRVLEHLNSALLSPQFLYLTHQPNALAVAAIYLAAKENEVKLVDGNWWEVLDVSREDLGFLVLAMGSLAGFAAAEMEKWNNPDTTLQVTIRAS